MTVLGPALAAMLATFAPQAERVEAPALESAPLPAGHVRVSGTVAALDPDGTLHREMEGTLLFSPGQRKVETVPIRGGRWEAIVAAGRPFEVLVLTLGGRSLDCDDLYFQPPLHPPIELVVPWARGREIPVVDARTGASIDGIELIQDLTQSGGLRYPSFLPPEWTVVTGARSPLVLPFSGTFAVGAPGRAWDHVGWSHSGQAPHIVKLEPACSLTVVVSGGDRPRPITLLVEWPLDRFHDGGYWIELPDDGRVVLDRLPPGRTRVTALLDFDLEPWINHVVPLGDATVTLAPGKPVELALPLAAAPAGLHDDGTVDRTGRVVWTGAGGPKPFTGDGEFSFVGHEPPSRNVDAPRGTPTGREVGPHFNRIEDGRAVAWRGRVAIRGGKFDLRVPYGSRLELRSLLLDGRDYELGTDHATRTVIDTTREPIRLAWPLDASAFGDLLPFTLRVVDAATKLDLARVRVVLGDHGKPPDSRHHPGEPAPDDRLILSLPSPLHLPLPRGKSPWQAWAGAEGYGWAPFEFRKDGSALVQLEPAADLVVVFANESLPKGTRVDVRRIPARDEVEVTGDRERVAELAPWWSGATPLPDSGHGERVADAPIGDAPTMELTGVPRGFLLVALAIHGSEGTRWIGFTPVDTRVGGRHEVALAAWESLLPRSSKMSGTLFVPPEWNAARPTLAFSPHRIELLADRDPVEIPRTELRAIEGTPGLYAWECRPLMNGTWVAELDEFGVAQSIELGPDGRDDVAIVVPPPAELRVRCVDGITGEPVDVDGVGLALASTRDAPARGMGRHPYERVRPSDRFVLRAPVGTFELDAESNGYAPLEQSVVIPAGGADVTLRFWRALGIRVRWKEGDAAIELRAGRATKVTDGDGNDVLLNVPDSWPRGMTLELSRPGRHCITFPRLRGYQPIAPLEVETRAGEYVEVTVELIPAR